MQILRKPEIIALEGHLNLVISQEIVDKVKFLCKNISKVEWSGVLFYKVNGTIKDRDNFSMEVVDIFLMDKGNKTYTEYTFDGDIAEFHMDNMMKDPETWGNIRIGHIHSHNSMPVYFSGTDTDELLENCTNHSYYLSLIVNNYGEYTAKVAFKSIVENYTAYDENGDPYPFPIKQHEPKVTMFTWECAIDSPLEILTVPEEFSARWEYVEEKVKRESEKAEKERLANLNKPKQISSPGPINGSNYGTQPTPATDWSNTKAPIPERKLYDGVDTSDDDTRHFNDSFEDLGTGLSEQFTCYLLRKGEVISDDNLADALESVQATGEPIEGLVAYIIDNFVSNYDQFFFSENTVDPVMEDYVDSITDITLDLLEYGSDKYTWVALLVKELEDFSDQIENAWKNVALKKEEKV